MPQHKKQTPREAFTEQAGLRLDVLHKWIEDKHIPWQLGPTGATLRDSNGELSPAFIPTSLEEFCQWAASPGFQLAHDNLARFRSISRASLYKPYHTDLRADVDAALLNIAACRVLQLETYNKSSIIEKQSATITYLEKVVVNQSTETRRARVRVVELTQAERVRFTKLRSTIAELRRLLSAEEALSKELTAALAKVTPIRRAK